MYKKYMIEILDKQTKFLLKRTPLKLSFADFLAYVNIQYPSLGNIYKYQAIPEGYEDANFLIYTFKGKYVLKIFSNERSKQNIKDYVRILKEAKETGVQTMALIKGRKSPLGKIANTYFIITKYFQGRNFQDKQPTLIEIRDITKEIAKLNTIKFGVEESYDSWGNANLLKEYNLNKGRLDQETINYLTPTINKLKMLKTGNFSKNLIHGDMQRLHVLKNAAGKFCIIDYGCARNDLKVYELSTFLAWFCLTKKQWRNRKNIWNTVVKSYTKIHNLKKSESASLLMLTEAAYAAYYFKTYLLRKQGDRSWQTRSWYKQAKTMLDLIRNW